MKPASFNFSTSSAIARSHSWANTHFFYRTGGKECDTFSLYTMTDRSIPGMSSWLQANTSWFSLRNAMSARRTIRLARVSIFVVLSNLELSRGISSSLFTSSTPVHCSFTVMVYRWLSIFSITIQHSHAVTWSPHNSPTPYSVENLIIRW